MIFNVGHWSNHIELAVDFTTGENTGRVDQVSTKVSVLKRSKFDSRSSYEGH
jgi:hypothetical protein